MVKKIDCFIPCRRKGDFLKNLNFLEINNVKLVEYTIQVSLRSNLFRNIYLLTDEKKIFESLKKKYQTIKLIYIKSTQRPFYEIIEKLKKIKIIQNKEKDICVLLPNYPFKTDLTLKKIYSIYKKQKLNFIASAKKEYFFFYSKKSNKLKSLNFSTKIKNRKKINPLYRLAGGIFFYNANDKFIKLSLLDNKNTFFINHHEAFGIYSLYDFITFTSLIDIDQSILIKMSNQ